jgi:pteridine reductase
MRDLRGQVAVVTGGARRLGACIALALARAGCNLVVHYNRSHDAALATASEAHAAGAEAIVVAGDLQQASTVDTLLTKTLERFGHADILVANAGAFRRTPIDSLSMPDWADMLDGNLRTTFLCAQRFGLHMRDAGHGAIVTLADVAGIRPWADYLPYSVAKAGVITLTHGLAKALAPQVRVNAVAPGPVLVPDDFDAAARDREAARTLLQRPGQPEHVASAVLELVRNDYITGVVLPVDGGRLLT